MPVKILNLQFRTYKVNIGVNVDCILLPAILALAFYNIYFSHSHKSAFIIVWSNFTILSCDYSITNSESKVLESLSENYETVNVSWIFKLFCCTAKKTLKLYKKYSKGGTYSIITCFYCELFLFYIYNSGWSFQTKFSLQLTENNK